MNKETFVKTLLIVLMLLISTLLVIFFSNQADDERREMKKNIDLKQNPGLRAEFPAPEKTELQKELENKDYSILENPEIEKEADEARLRMEQLDLLGGGSSGPTEEDLAKMSPEEREGLEAEARARLDRLNELRKASVSDE